MKILHITPTFFSSDSIKGGAERYVDELARAMAKNYDVTILSFSDNPQCMSINNVQYRIKKPLFYFKKSKLNPISLSFFKELIHCDVVHIHQLFTIMTELILIFAFILKKPVFITDHGGGGRTYLTRFKISRFLAKGLLCVSQYSAKKLSDYHEVRIPIWGGVKESEIKAERVESSGRKILTIGRFYQHKGMHILIKAIEGQELYIVGSGGDLNYLNYLKSISNNKNIFFKEGLEDIELEKLKAECHLAVFASTNIGTSGERLKGEPELLGLAPIECMGKNIPTIVSNIGAYPEIAFPDVNFIYEHDNVNELRQKINSFFINKTKNNFSSHILSKFTWEKAAEKCIESYRLYGDVK